MDQKIRYVSLFSGIGGFELALHSVFPNAECVGFCEINKHCRAIYSKQFPSHPLLASNVQQADFRSLEGKVDLVLAGFPCQDLSSINTRARGGLQGGKSSLFFEALRCLKETKARYFVFENVGSMQREEQKKITALLGTSPVLLDAAHFTYQRRRRLFWANFKIVEVDPMDGKKGGSFVSLLEPVSEVSHLAKSQAFVDYIHRPLVQQEGKIIRRLDRYRIHHDTNDTYSHCLLQGYGNAALFDRRVEPPLIRKLSVRESERLQGFPDDWTSASVPEGAKYRALGNAVNVKVARHIFQCFKCVLKKK